MKPKRKHPKFPIVLASASSYKKELLDRLQIDFSCHAANIDESIFLNECPKKASLRLAEQKAKAVAINYQNTNTLIIGCDQVAYINDNKTNPFLGKPGTLETAKQQLQRSSGNIVSFYTAFYIHQTQKNKTFKYVDITKVKYRDLNEADINDYLQRENALDCAGSCKVEGLGISLLEQVESKDPSALIGLRLIALRMHLKNLI